MTTTERTNAVVDYGFTERQARFLVLVMRHAGLCVKRQYATFAAIANGGEKCNAFFKKLVRRGLVVTTDCIHNRAQVYHVHHKPLYHAIGDPDSRFRRAVPARSVAERLMRLDTALMTADLEWLTTRAEKLAYLRARTPESSGARDDVAVQPASIVANPFPGTFPIGIDPRGHLVVLYLATVPWTDDFRTFLIGHLEVLCTASVWTLRVVFPRALGRAVRTYHAVVHEELENPLAAENIPELKHHFFHRRRGTDFGSMPEALRDRLTRYAEAFSGPRFTHLYRRWLADGDVVLTPGPSAIPDALASGRGRVECVVLPHCYDHLLPLVDRRRSRRRCDLMREERGDETSRSVNPVLNPAP